MRSRDQQRLDHILEYCQDITEDVTFCQGSFEKFQENKRAQRSVSFCILQIGELAKDLSEDFIRETQGQVAWKQIRGMRNMVVHDYGSVKLEVVWNTITSDIPSLQTFCEKHLRSET